MRVNFQELNEGGLMARFLGLRLFMPLSHLARPEPGKFMSQEVRGSGALAGFSVLDPWPPRPIFGNVSCSVASLHALLRIQMQGV
jgi:hypothetical protein